MDVLDRTIWVTWEKQRRTETLAGELAIPLHRFHPPSSYLLKILSLSLKTVCLMIAKRPRRLIIQNPSMALAALTCTLKPLFGYRLIVDRHSNFKFHTRSDGRLKYRIFHYLSRATIAKADLTIVTNEFLAEVVRSWGGRPFVLQDMLPDMNLAEDVILEEGRHILFVTSFSDDEPIAEVLEAAKSLPEDTVLHVTGNHRKARHRLPSDIGENVRFTGFLAERDFQSLMKSCDVVLAMTTQDHTLLCSAYEAVSLEKPLVLSDKQALREYFDEGVRFTSPEPAAIARTLTRVLDEQEEAAEEITRLKAKLQQDWAPRFEALKHAIGQM